MSKAGHRLTFTLRDRRYREAELWQALEPLLKRRKFQAYIVDLLITDLLLSDEEREQRRRTARLIEQAVWHGEPGSFVARLHDLITTGVTAPEGNFVETEKE